LSGSPASAGPHSAVKDTKSRGQKQVRPRFSGPRELRPRRGYGIRALRRTSAAVRPYPRPASEKRRDRPTTGQSRMHV